MMGAVRPVVTAVALIAGYGIIPIDSSAPDRWQQPATVEGIVVDAVSGRPVAGAAVAIAVRGSQTAQTHSSQNGRFLIQGMPAGTYMLSAKAAGYLDSTAGQIAPGERGLPVRLDSGSRQELPLRLWKGAAVAGIVTHVDGEPLAGVPVELIPARLPAGQELRTELRSTTDDRGAFRMSTLVPGEYYLVASLNYGKQDVGSGSVLSVSGVQGAKGRSSDSITLRAYFPLATSLPEDAAAISLRSGTAREDLVLRVGSVRSAPLALEVGDGNAVTPFAKVTVNQGGNLGGRPRRHVDAVFTGRTDELGRLTIPALPIGSYEILAVDDQYRPGAGSGQIVDGARYFKFSVSTPSRWAWERVQLDGPQTTKLTVGRPRVSGMLRSLPATAGSPPMPVEPMVTFVPVAGPARRVEARADRTGRFTVEFPEPGIFRLSVETFGSPSSVRIGNRTLAGREIATWDLIDGMPIDVVLPTGDTGIDVRIGAPPGTRPTTATVFVLPGSEQDRLRAVSGDPSLTVLLQDRVGRFRSGQLMPGRYLVAAVEGANFDTDWRSEAVMRRLVRVATPVDVQDGRRPTVEVSAVQLR
jgi:hypothetical protein